MLGTRVVLHIRGRAASILVVVHLVTVLFVVCDDTGEMGSVRDERWEQRWLDDGGEEDDLCSVFKVTMLFS